MQAQWALQRQILARQRSLGIVGELPGFQGNVPAALKDIEKDSNMTVQGDTAWMYSVDPLFGKIADAWMQTLIADFGTDHWYQLDGYFNGGTAPWRGAKRRLQGTGGRAVEYALPSRPSRPVRAGNPPCTWSGVVPGYLAGCDRDCESFATLAEAQAACIADAGCGGVTVPPAGGRPELRASNVPQASPTGETAYYITNELECHGAPPDPVWKELGAAAYAGLARTDPDAVWSFQGWAIIDWNSAQQASSFRGFVDAVPDGHFVVIDMSTDGTGEWLKWDNASFFGAPFVWTSLHDFGGTDGMKGDLVHANALPFAGLPAYGGANTTVIGSGYTPEGIDQNPVYYELVAQAAFRDGPVRNLTAHAIDRARRRYGLGALPGVAPGVDAAWAALVGSTYAQDLSVQDGTGVAHLPGSDTSQFLPDRYTPTPRLCATFRAWEALLGAAAAVGDAAGEPFRYDLVNLGRELLAQLSTPMSHNFSDALKAVPLQPAALAAAGGKYAELLRDIDALVATDAAFLVGPVLAAARAWGDGHADCAKGTVPAACPDFYEWNARTQITTWNPVPAPDSPAIPDGPDDYAAKHWSGLIADFYAVRAELILAQAQADAAAGRPLNGTAVDAIKAAHAYAWQNDVAPYPVEPVGDAVGVSVEMVAKWGGAFAPYC